VHDGPMIQNEDQTACYGVHYTNELVNRYCYLGDKVRFLMRSKRINTINSSNYSEITHPSFSFVEVPNYKSIRTRFNKGRAIEIIRNEVRKADALILRMPSANAVEAYYFAREFGKPFIVEMVACVFDALWNYDWRGKLLAFPKFWKYQRIIKECPFVIYVTTEFLQSRYPTKNKSLACSDVILQPSEESTLNDRLSQIKNLNRPIKLITIAAIDVPYKGQADVLSVLSQLSQDDFEYWIVGQGDPKRLLNIIEKKNLKNVKIIGSVKHSEVFELLLNANLYIQPSRQEGLPRSVVEAMSVALPSLGTNIAGIPELLPHECIYDPNKLSSLKELLLSLNQPKLAKWAIQNFQKSKEFNSVSLDKQRIEFYQIFLDAKNK